MKIPRLTVEPDWFAWWLDLKSGSAIVHRGQKFDLIVNLNFSDAQSFGLTHTFQLLQCPKKSHLSLAGSMGQ
jgi:hypothetical protein